MINRTITGFLVVLLLASYSALAFGQSASQKSHKLSSKSGKSTYKYPASKKSYKSSANTNLFNKHKEFHNKYYKPHPGTKAYNQKYYGNYGHSKKHYYKNHKKHYNYYGYKPYYKPYGGYVYYGYNDYYPEDYYYEDVPYDGYGSTLGTVPERRSNLDVNNYVYGPDYDIYPESYPEDGYEYPDEYQNAPDSYSYAPEPERRTIYIWTDERGVEHFVNDPDLVPEEFRGDLRVVEEY